MTMPIEKNITDSSTPSLEAIAAIAKDAYIYGLPIVVNYAVMNEYAIDPDSGQYKATFNTLVSDSRVFTYEDTSIVTPNSDTPYSMVWLDLRAEPMVISVPEVSEDRYYSVQMVDGNTYNYGYIGSRTTGSYAGSYLIVGPDWNEEIPDSIQHVFRSTTPFSLTIFRTQLFDANDMPNVVNVQEGYKVQAMSAFLNQPAPPAAPNIDFVPACNAGIEKNFYQYLDAALAFVPITSENQDIRNELASIGIGTGSFDFDALPKSEKAAYMIGMKQGDDQVSGYMEIAGVTVINGWSIGSVFGDQAFFNGDWLKRACGTKSGTYGNDAEEAVYPMTRQDGEGETLDGSKHNYVMTFEEGQLPPVNSFWSITMYDDKTQLLIENPIDRYLVNSPMLSDMHKNDDGSLPIYIQKDSPGPDKEANWLPAPDGPIYLVMRLYWPATGETSVLPIGEGTWNPPKVVKA